MPQEYYIVPVRGSDGGEVDNTLPGGGPSSGGRPSHPIVLPPLPGIWPKPGEPSLPIVLPPTVPGTPTQPIYIEGSPEHPIVLPPNTIWPPLPPDVGIWPSQKVAILILVVGVGYRWFIYDPQAVPPVPQPK